FLHAVDINFSRKKWNQIFRDIDLSHDDKISFNEFFMFVFLHDNRQPDPDEVARVEHLSKEVQKKRTLFEKMVKIRRQSVFYPFAARKPGSVIPGNIASSTYAQGKSDQNQSFVDENDDDNNSLAK
ncbi:MAG: hypothetical protein K2Z81_24375, partial [Cyanobacteria bacterium]|nr:hypothetical protein [Cyanobacteriota bacterium]